MSDPIRNQRTGFQPEPCQAQALWRVHFHNRPCAHLCDVCKAVMSQSIPAEDITMEMAVSPALHLPCNCWPPMQDYVTIADTVSHQGPPSEANDGPELPLTPDEHRRGEISQETAKELLEWVRRLWDGDTDIFTYGLSSTVDGLIAQAEKELRGD